MVEAYLKQRKGPLARFALQTLLELAPDHPRRGDYENWVQLLDEEVVQQKRAEKAFEAGRAAVRSGDFAAAEEQLEIVRDNDLSGELGDKLAFALEQAQKGEQRSTTLADIRARLDACLQARDPDGSAAQLQILSGLEVARVTLQEYQRRIDEIRSSQQLAALSEQLQEQFRQQVAAEDWAAAREIAVQYSELRPSDQRGGELLAELSRHENLARKSEAVDAGIRQLEQLLDAGQLQQAELALRIVVQMNPGHPRRRELEERLAALRG